MSGLLGRYQTTMDDKGRFALPAKLRAVKGPDPNKLLLEGDLIITKGLEGCLTIYPQPEWSDIQSRLGTLNFTSEDYRYFGRLFYSAAGTVTPDRHGRILIPSHLIGEADLKRELLVIGVDRWVEIWNPDRFKYYLEQHRRSFEDVAEKLFSGDGSQKQE